MEVPLITPAVVSYLRQAARSTRRLASICLGSFVLGESRAAQWPSRNYALALRAATEGAVSEVPIDMDKIFIADGQIWTSPACQRI